MQEAAVVSRSSEYMLADSQQENETLVLEPEGTEFCQRSHELGKGPGALERNGARPIP